MAARACNPTDMGDSNSRTAAILFERRTLLKAIFTAIALFLPHLTQAQDLVPRAYVITPVRGNAITLSASVLHGGLDFNGVIPV
jgi:hypothetical protein